MLGKVTRVRVSLVRRLGPNKRVSYLRAKMSFWNPHTVLFWDGKALACHITGLLICRKAFLECRKAF